MGSFIGHLVPGAYFTVWAIWSSFNIFWRYFNAKFSEKGKWKGVYVYKSSVSYGWRSTNRSHSVPFEVWLKLVVLGIAIFGEYYTALNDKWQFQQRHNLQHIMMYAFFAFHPIMELLYYFKIEMVPPKLDYLCLSLAFSAEAFLFHEHLHGRANMDVQMHTYQVYAIMACALTGTLEMVYINDVRPAVGRAVCTLLQGTWFCQIGSILYPPSGIKTWTVEDHSEMMLISVIFTLHLAAAISVQAIIALVIYQKLKRKGGFQPLKAEDEDSEADLPLVTSNSNVQA